MTIKARRVAIATALGVELRQEKITFADYAGRVIAQQTKWLCGKLAKDTGHAAHAGWITETLRNPIEVWERIDNGLLKLHYYSAYTDGSTRGIVSYMAVAVSSNGDLVTAFQKDSANAIDERRNGIPLFCCY